MKLSHAAILISVVAMTANAFVVAPRAGYAASSILRGVFGSSSSSSAAASTRLSSSSTSSDVESLIQSEIDGNKVVVFSKTYCPYCTATKALFRDLGVEAKVVELDQRPDGSDIQAALLRMTGQRTVPSTFVGGQHLGGNDKAQAAARSGELQKKLGMS
jgi:glutaredoxin 3